ncbi:kynurenine 3-monooxygenase [Cordyceps javanica]|nr:kynurenine 3-monooxygenase [Cordyceps javanica]
MKAISLIIFCVALASAKQTALWVPQCGDEVLMLGTDVAKRFKSLNTLSVEDIDKILAFYTYTVAYESAAPSGFRYDGGYLVKDPPPKRIITTCTKPRPDIGVTNGATPARSSPIGLPSTNTQAQTANTTMITTVLPSMTAAPTSCYTTGPAVTDSASVMNIIFSFCGLHSVMTAPTSISSIMTVSDVQMLLEINPASCVSISSATENLPAQFGSPENSRPTGALEAYNKALWPCVKLYEIWEYCNGNETSGNKGRGGFGTIGCNELGLKPPAASKLAV